MSIRTPDEIDRQIAALEQQRQHGPQRNELGGDNIGPLDAKIAVLKGLKEVGDYRQYNRIDANYGAALKVRRWLDGKIKGDLF